MHSKVISRLITEALFPSNKNKVQDPVFCAMTNNLAVSVPPQSGMLSNGSMRGSMQQGWGPQGPTGGTAGPMMGQGVGPGCMVPNSVQPTRGAPASRAMVNMRMMGNGEKEKS